MKNTTSQQYNALYLLRYLRPYRWLTIFTIICLIAARAASTIQPVYLKKIIDYIPGHLGESLAGNPAILSLLLFYFGFYLLSFIFEFLRDYLFAPVEMGVGRKVAEDVFDYLLKLPISYHYDQKTGTLARRISRGAQSINFILDFLIISILPTLFELIFVTALLLRLYPARYGLITLGTILIYGGFTAFATELRQKYRLAANMAEDETSAIQVETISNVDTVKYFGNERYQQKKFGIKIKEWFDLSVRSNQLFAAISAGQSLILMIGFGLIVYFAVSEALQQILSVGDLVLLTTYIVRLAAPIVTLGFVYRRLKDGITDLASMAQIFGNKVDIKDAPDAKMIKNPHGEVVFDNVTFKYGRRQALDGLSLTIPAGKRVAIVGPSGAGKSTIVKQLFRLDDPTVGRILIDGVDLRQIKNKQLRDIIALVPQEPTLFNDTIAANIRFGKPNASEAEVKKAITLAHLDDLISRLPDGLNTIVGERGVKLSGGEKQRVAIARAVIKDPKVLVFDEATSNLDAESEQEIIRAVREVSKGRTTISIAHRLPTITDSDIIFVIDHGKLAEQGTHQELLKKKGLYARLWQVYERSSNTPIAK